MSQAVAFSKTGTKKESAVKLDKTIFDVEANHELVAQAYRSYLAASRQSDATTLTRGLVSGGGKKPHRQKGTGRARAGSSRIVQWRHGGVVFGPLGNENYLVNMNLKAKRAAIRQALSLKAQAGNIVVIEAFNSLEGKVKPTVELLSKIKAGRNTLIVVSEKDLLVDRATRNIEGVKAVQANYLNVFEIMNADTIVFCEPALPIISEWLGEAKSSVKAAAPVVEAKKPVAKKAPAKAKPEAKS